MPLPALLKLGRDLRDEFIRMEDDTGASARNVVDRIVCADYSRIVINALRGEQRKERGGKEEGRVAVRGGSNYEKARGGRERERMRKTRILSRSPTRSETPVVSRTSQARST